MIVIQHTKLFTSHILQPCLTGDARKVTTWGLAPSLLVWQSPVTFKLLLLLVFKLYNFVFIFFFIWNKSPSVSRPNVSIIFYLETEIKCVFAWTMFIYGKSLKCRNQLGSLFWFELIVKFFKCWSQISLCTLHRTSRHLYSFLDIPIALFNTICTSCGS